MSRYTTRNSYSWSGEIAYLTGLIAADGCLYGDKRHINLTSKDYESLDNLNNILGKDYRIVQKVGGYGTTAHQINFSNTAFYDFLETVGLHSAKSKTIKTLDVPDKYYADFLRGYFDGDGTIYGYEEKRWQNSFVYYSSFASGSYNFLIWLQANNTRQFGMGPGRLHKGVNVMNLTYAKRDSRLLFESMYHCNTTHKLNRKYDRWIAFFDRDRYSIL